MQKKVDSKQGKRKRAPKKPRRTAHRIKASKPAVKKRIAALKRAWNRGADPVTLGSQILALTGKVRCSFRGLGEQIRRPESTLRRYAKLASLPENERIALLQGETAKAVLARNADRERQERSRSRLVYERETGKLSDEVADLILEFCRYEDGEDKVRCLAVDMDNLLWHTRWITRGGAWRQPAKLAPDLQTLFEINRPKEEAGVIWLSHRAEWLAAILMTVAPEEDIRELAMTKAEQRRLELG